MIKIYSKFASRNPTILIVIVIIFTSLSIYGIKKIEMAGLKYIDIFPEDKPEIIAIKKVEDNFASTRSLNIVVKAVDVRYPEVVEYIDIISNKLESIEEIVSAMSISDFLKENGRLISDYDEICMKLEKEREKDFYVSEDYSIALIRLRLSDVEGKEEEVVKKVREIIYRVPKPSTVYETELEGDVVNAVIFKELTPEDMSKTTKFSFIGVIVVILLLFRSIIYGFIPLFSVVLGLVWLYGMLGILGVKISSTLAGVASMTIGIGIDFAIQIINRFRQEVLELKGEEEKAMENTLRAVIFPMSITTLASIIGFRALSLAELEVMHDLGLAMSLGVLACYLSALTFVPSAVLLSRKLKRRVVA